MQNFQLTNSSTFIFFACSHSFILLPFWNSVQPLLYKYGGLVLHIEIDWLVLAMAKWYRGGLLNKSKWKWRLKMLWQTLHTTIETIEHRPLQPFVRLVTFARPIVRRTFVPSIGWSAVPIRKQKKRFCAQKVFYSLLWTKWNERLSCKETEWKCCAISNWTSTIQDSRQVGGLLERGKRLCTLVIVFTVAVGATATSEYQPWLLLLLLLGVVKIRLCEKESRYRE